MDKNQWAVRTEKALSLRDSESKLSLSPKQEVRMWNATEGHIMGGSKEEKDGESAGVEAAGMG